jgi:hypothetical protein
MRVPWNFSDSRLTNLSLDDFLAAKEAAGVTFFNGKEPWMKGVNKLTWQTFFRVCTQEMESAKKSGVRCPRRSAVLRVEYLARSID